MNQLEIISLKRETQRPVRCLCSSGFDLPLESKHLNQTSCSDAIKAKVVSAQGAFLVFEGAPACRRLFLYTLCPKCRVSVRPLPVSSEGKVAGRRDRNDPCTSKLWSLHRRLKEADLSLRLGSALNLSLFRCCEVTFLMARFSFFLLLPNIFPQFLPPPSSFL